MVIYDELQVHNIFCPGGGKCPILPSPMGAHGSMRPCHDLSTINSYTIF